jgi:hypothetical protein
MTDEVDLVGMPIAISIACALELLEENAEQWSAVKKLYGLPQEAERLDVLKAVIEEDMEDEKRRQSDRETARVVDMVYEKADREAALALRRAVAAWRRPQNREERECAIAVLYKTGEGPGVADGLKWRRQGRRALDKRSLPKVTDSIKRQLLFKTYLEYSQELMYEEETWAAPHARRFKHDKLGELERRCAAYTAGDAETRAKRKEAAEELEDLRKKGLVYWTVEAVVKYGEEQLGVTKQQIEEFKEQVRIMEDQDLPEGQRLHYAKQQLRYVCTGPEVRDLVERTYQGEEFNTYDKVARYMARALAGAGEEELAAAMRRTPETAKLLKRFAEISMRYTRQASEEAASKRLDELNKEFDTPAKRTAEAAKEWIRRKKEIKAETDRAMEAFTVTNWTETHMTSWETEINDLARQQKQENKTAGAQFLLDLCEKVKEQYETIQKQHAALERSDTATTEPHSNVTASRQR